MNRRAGKTEENGKRRDMFYEGGERWVREEDKKRRTYDI